MIDNEYNETIQIKKSQGRDFAGNVTYSEPYDSPARVKEKFQLIRDKTSKEVTASLEIKVPSKIDIDVDYIAIYNNKEYIVIAKSSKKDIEGTIHHKKVYC